MRVLAVDTATAATAVALVRFSSGPEPKKPEPKGPEPKGPEPKEPEPKEPEPKEPEPKALQVLGHRRHVDPRAHGELLAPMIDELLTGAGIRPADLTAIVAGDGPGPFTGLRVGLATVAAMAQALELPAYGVCSLDGIGAAASGHGEPGRPPVLVATDARRREVYWALYADGRRRCDPAVDRPVDVVPVLLAHDVRQAYGEGARRYRDVLGLPVAEHPAYPDPAVLATVAYDRIVAGAPGERLTPRYLRRADTAGPGPRKSVSR